MSLKGKKVSESVVKTTHLVLPSDANALGSIFGGQLMSWIDLAAAMAAQRHSRQICVTASIEQLDFMNPIKVSDIVHMDASVNYAGRSSMEVGVRVETEHPRTGERYQTANAYLAFVALGPDGKTIEIPPVIPETDDEKRRYQEAEQRREERLAKKKK